MHREDTEPGTTQTTAGSTDKNKKTEEKRHEHEKKREEMAEGVCRQEREEEDRCHAGSSLYESKSRACSSKEQSRPKTPAMDPAATAVSHSCHAVNNGPAHTGIVSFLSLGSKEIRGGNG